VPRLARLAIAFAVPLALAFLAPPPAVAGSYTVRQCDWAAGNGHHDFVWQSAGSPTVDQYVGSGCGEFGLAARNGGGGTHRTYPSGAYGGWFAYAPDGTVFTQFSGAFGVLAGCCVSGMATYAEATQWHNGSGGRTYLFQGNLGNETWGAPSGLAGPVGRSWSSSASGFVAKRVGFHLQCGPGFSCTQSVYGDLRLRGRSFDFTLRDDAAPTVGAPGGTLLAGGWARGTRTLSFPAHDTGGGLTGVEAAFDSGTVLRSPSSCTIVAGRYARLRPCPATRAGDWAIDTASLPDGARQIALRAVDVGGATGSRTVVAHVDNGAPTAPRELAVVGGEGWRANDGFELRWTNPTGQHAPIARARWRACRVGAEPAGSDCVSGVRAAAGVESSDPIALPDAGEWEAEVWLEDAAGNSDPATASGPRRLRFDPHPPRLDILPADPARPTRIAVATADLSGVVDGKVELRRYGSDAWIGLPTERGDDRLTAEVEQSRLGAGGLHDVRVRAVDAAGNEGLAQGVRDLPAANPPPTSGRTSPPIDARRGGVAPRPGAGRRRVRGPARVTMTARVRVAKRRAARRGGRRVRPRWRDVRRLVAIGERPVHFRGRVGRPVPWRGKLVEIQAHFRGRWRTISTVRARRGGHWSFRYRFRPSPWRAVHRMRARAPVETGYPFSAGHSRPVRVTVPPGWPTAPRR
jgi:hypothetical protein